MNTKGSFRLCECVCLLTLLCVFQLFLVSQVVAGSFAVVEVGDINPGVADSRPEWLTSYGGDLFFSAIGLDGERLYKTDGVKLTKFDINPSSGRRYPSWLTPFKGELFFSGGRSRLYKTDGKRVVEIPEVNPGEVPYHRPEFLTPLGEALFFRQGTVRNELFKTDGETVTGLGIKMVLHLHTAKKRKPLLAPLDDELFYASYATNGWELFKTDGNRATELADINPGPESSHPQGFTPFRGGLFFTAHGPEGGELYKTDGTTVSLVADIYPGHEEPGTPESSYPIDFTEFAGQLFFSALGPEGRELYQTDGTTVTQVADIYPGPAGSRPTGFTPFGDELFFAATGPNGWEPFKTDGTTVTRVGDINPGSADSSPDWFTPFAGELFFSALGPYGRELYRTNGNTVVQVADINPGVIDSNPEWLTVVDGELFFAATGSNGRELYKVVPEPNVITILCPGLVAVTLYCLRRRPR